MDQVRFHPSFDKLEQAAVFAKAIVSFASVVNLFDIILHSDIYKMLKLARQTDKYVNSERVLESLQTSGF